MKTFTVILSVTCILITGYAQSHDIEVVEIIDPEGFWVEDGKPVTLDIFVLNNGDVVETNVPLFLSIIDLENGTKVYEETVILSEIQAGASIPVNFMPWIPDGLCDEWMHSPSSPPEIDEVGRRYELTAYSDLETDQNRDNDTTIDTVSCLLSHDVGVLMIENEEGHEWGNSWNDPYPTGTDFSCVVSVENFGYNEEHNVRVDLEIIDMDKDPDSMVWRCPMEIPQLDWRDNDSSNPYVVGVEFPLWTTPSEDWYRFFAFTLLEDDECSMNDTNPIFIAINCPDAIEEEIIMEGYYFDVSYDASRGSRWLVRFSIPDPCETEIVVYDVTGCKVATLAERRFEPGTFFRTWAGTDDAGNKVSSGIYLIRMEAGGFEATRKVFTID
jgi:hypothetical protein